MVEWQSRECCNVAESRDSEWQIQSMKRETHLALVPMFITVHTARVALVTLNSLV